MQAFCAWDVCSEPGSPRFVLAAVPPPDVRAGMKRTGRLRDRALALGPVPSELPPWSTAEARAWRRELRAAWRAAASQPQSQRPPQPQSQRPPRRRRRGRKGKARAQWQGRAGGKMRI